MTFITSIIGEHVLLWTPLTIYSSLSTILVITIKIWNANKNINKEIKILENGMHLQNACEMSNNNYTYILHSHTCACYYK